MVRECQSRKIMLDLILSRIYGRDGVTCFNVSFYFL